MIHRHRGNRRKQDAAKAIRKQKIANSLYGKDWYDNVHQYSKNKIHCSCPWCRQKTNAQKNKHSTGSHRNNWKASDIKKITSLNLQEKEYAEGIA